MTTNTASHRVPPCYFEQEGMVTTQDMHEALLLLEGTKGPLGNDYPIADNVARAQRAMMAVRTYAREDGVYIGESFPCAVQDLIVDLQHLLDFSSGLTDEQCEKYPNTLDEIVEVAKRRYEEEV